MIFVFFLCLLTVAITYPSFFFDKWMLFGMTGSLWVPQIIKNVRYGSKNAPCVAFAVTQTFSIHYIPLYLKLNPYNFLMVEQDITTSICLFSYVIIQLIVLIR